MSSIDIASTLKQNLIGDALSLASDVFPGPIQTALDYYLNGITIPIGSNGSLRVSGAGAAVTLQMDSVVFQGQATADKATLAVNGTGQYSDASVAVAFTKQNGGVVVNLNAAMGQHLTWKISDLWPAVFSQAPFNDLALAQGTLALTTSGTSSIDFTGTGALAYQGTPLAFGALRVVYTGSTSGNPDTSKLGILIGVVVPSWSPGSIWKPLNDVTFKQSGLLFSSLEEKDSSTLADLHLINGTDVPSVVDGSFKVAPGITFFTTLELDGFLGPLTNILGSGSTLALYANKDPKNTLTILAKFAAGNFKPSSDAIFEFEDFQLEWVIKTGSYDLTASANGKFFPPDGSVGGIDLSLSATIKPEIGDIQLGLSLDNWVHPFGYQKLTVIDFSIGVSLGASSEGVTISASGDFQFTVENGTKTFEFGVAGEITDFEIVTGIAFLLKADGEGQEVSIGDLVEAITDVNVQDIPIIEVIDEILQVRNFDFAVVEADSLTIGDKTFEKGFTLDAEFDILQQEEVILNVEITGTGADEQFSGLAEMQQSVVFGDIFALCRYNPITKQPDCSAGPIVAVSSKGMVIAGVNNGDPVYLYTSGYLRLLDVIKASLYGIATTSGMFQFSMSVQAGTPMGNNGVWAGREIWVGLDPKEFAFQAGFDFNFGWKNESIGPLKVFGVDLIPKISLPDFAISAGLGVDADGKAGTFQLSGEFTFDFLGLNINYGSPGNLKTIFSIDLGSAPQTLADIRDKVWNWLLENITSLLEDILNVVDKFISWVKSALSEVALVAAKVAQVLKDTFNQAVDAIGQALKDIGYAASEIYDALVNGLKVAVDVAEKVVNDLFAAAGKCAAATAAEVGIK